MRLSLWRWILKSLKFIRTPLQSPPEEPEPLAWFPRHQPFENTLPSSAEIRDIEKIVDGTRAWFDDLLRMWWGIEDIIDGRLGWRFWARSNVNCPPELVGCFLLIHTLFWRSLLWRGRLPRFGRTYLLLYMLELEERALSMMVQFCKIRKGANVECVKEA